jgi:hypothetical protein
MQGMPKFAGALGLVLFAAGCVLSVAPVVPESEAIFDERLVGAWEESGGSDSAVITRAAAPATYAIRYTSGGKTGTFEARLGRLGERLVLDAWPAPSESDLPEPYRGVLIGGHMVLSLEIAADDVRMSIIEPDALENALRTGDPPLPYSSADGQLVLLADTPRLRAELGRYLTRPGALDKPVVFRRTVLRPGPV